MAQLDSLDAAQQTATQCFALGIPILVASAVLDAKLARAGDRAPWPQLRITAMYVSIIADIICFAGLYWMLTHSDATAARWFLWTSLAAFFVAGSVELAIEAMRFHKRRAHRTPAKSKR